MIFRDQVIIFSQPGALPEKSFRELVGKAKELDMDQVRADISKQQGDKA
jgi:thioredoxin 1